jgi:hypothetical protein
MTPTQACNAWSNTMLSELASRQVAPHFRSYVAAGQTHTILRAPLFVSEQSAGLPFPDWLGALLRDDRLPANASCPTCQAPQNGCAP